MAQRIADDKEQHAAQDIRRGISTAGGRAGDKAVSQADQVRAAHDVQAAGIFDEVDHLVHHGRQDDLDALGQDDLHHGIHIAEALALRRLELPLGDGGNTGTHHLGHVCAGVDAQGSDAGGNDVGLHPRKGQCVIQETHLQHHGGILDAFHIDPGDGTEQLTPGGRHQAEQEAQRQRQHQSRRCRPQGIAKAGKEGGAVGPQLSPCFRFEYLVHRNASRQAAGTALQPPAGSFFQFL